jgi:lipoprotein-anchoring transpeptidase ErfK/SrfK
MILTAAVAAAALLLQAQTPAPTTQKPAPPSAERRTPSAEDRTPSAERRTPSAGAPTRNADLAALPLQVMLDRAGFSPGVLDGRLGTNTKKALALYQQQGGTAEPSGGIASYTITADDAAGPFVEKIPSDLAEQATLPSLGYTTIVEALAERFHTTPALLQRLNPESRFQAGDQILVPDVEPLLIPVQKPEISPEAKAADKADAARATGTSGRKSSSASTDANTILQRPDVVVKVSRASSAVTVEDTTGRVIFAAPVTTGSERDPLPIGDWKVLGVQVNPPFNYNPDLFWDADPSHTKARIPAGPNNPVGLVWIALNKEHYGIHGSPEPSTIGRTESHGCVRLTNWDALKLAGMVKPGTKVVFTDEP